MEGRSKLFLRARLSNLERPKIHYHILKKTEKNMRLKKDISDIDIESNISMNLINNNKRIDSLNKSNNIDYNNNLNKRPISNQLFLPKINNYKTNIINQTNFNTNNLIQCFEKNISKKSINNNLIEVNSHQMNKKNITLKDSFIKENIFYTVLLFMDPKSLFNFMISNKQFFKIAVACDEIWYNFYIKKFCSPINHPVDYDKFKSKWRNVFIETTKKINQRNYNNLKKAFLEKFKKNNYSIRKDCYFLINNLYKNLKPLYHILINDKLFQTKYILSNKSLSHVNLFIVFNEPVYEMNLIQKIKLLFSEKNIGVHDKLIIEYNIKQIHFKQIDEELINKNYKIYYFDDLIISTFNNNIFFINISIPICKICEKVFDYLKGIHSINKSFECDCDRNFGLYDYSLLINLKSWNTIYFSLPFSTCDFKENENNEDLYFISNTIISSNNKIKFSFKAFGIKDTIENFLIFDIFLLSYKGDHILCESKPLIIKEDNNSIINYDEYESNQFIGIIQENKYTVIFKFKINEEENYHALTYIELRLNKTYIESIFKNINK